MRHLAKTLVIMASAPAVAAQAAILDFESFNLNQGLETTGLTFSINDGANASRYTIVAPVGSGNNSTRAIQVEGTDFADFFVTIKLLADATEAPSATDVVRYSFHFTPINGDGGGFGGMTLHQLNASNAQVGSATGPYLNVSNNRLRYRRISGNDPLFDWASSADDPNPANPTAIVPLQGHWYEFVAEIDPNGTSTLNGSGEFGTIKYYLRDLSVPGSQLEALQLKYVSNPFTSLWPAADNQWYTELPAYLNANRNTVNWNAISFASRGSNPIQLDNFKIEVVPEPATLALSAIGVLCLCCRRTK